MGIIQKWKNLKDEYKEETKKYESWEDKKEKMKKKLWMKLYGTTNPAKIKELKRKQKKVPLTVAQARRMARLGKIRKGAIKGVVKTVKSYKESEARLQKLEDKFQKRKRQLKKIGRQLKRGHAKFTKKVESTFPQQTKKRKGYKKSEFDFFRF